MRTLSLFLASMTILSRAASLSAAFEKHVSEFTLANGMRFIVVERHESPVLAFETYVGVGSTDDPAGRTGLTNLLNRLAFKGTEAVGTINAQEEAKALEAVERTYDALEAERRKGLQGDRAKMTAKLAQLKNSMESADRFALPGAWERIVGENGGEVASFAVEDASGASYVLPSSRAELWFRFEAERLAHPVFREFYRERDRAVQQRRAESEQNAEALLLESLLATAFAAHPYRNPKEGWTSDLEQLRRTEAEQFYSTYFVPNNTTVAIVGDISAVQAKQWAEIYFGKLPSGVRPPGVRTSEPLQSGSKRVAVAATEALLAIAYKRPDQYSADAAVLTVLSQILGGDQYGVLYQEIVAKTHLAQGVGAQATLPGAKYPSLLLLMAAPAQGRSIEENEKAIYAAIDHLKKFKVSDEALQLAKRTLRASALRLLESNAGAASKLAQAASEFGDWRHAFTELDQYERVTAADIQNAANAYFVESTRTVAYTYIRGDDDEAP